MFDLTYENIRLISSWSLIVVAAFGLPINILPLWILCRKRTRSMFHNLLLILSISDLVSFWINSCKNWAKKMSFNHFGIFKVYDLRTTLFMEITKILFEKCKIGVILRSDASHILIKLVQEHWFFLAWTRAFLGFWRSVSPWPVRPGTRNFFLRYSPIDVSNMS